MKHSHPRPHSSSSRSFSKGSRFTSRDERPKTKRFYDAKPKRDFEERADGFEKDKTSHAKPYAKKFVKAAFGGKPSFRKEDRSKSFRKDNRPPTENSVDTDVQPSIRKQDRPRTATSFQAHKKNHRRDFKLERKPESTTEKGAADHDLIWGLHAARAAWLNPQRRCTRLWLTEAGRDAFALTMAEADQNLLKRPTPKIVERPVVDQITPPNSVHQGLVLEALPLQEPNLRDLISGDHPADLLLMLDQVTDPHNVGAILRSAAAFGASAVIMTERNAPNTTGVLAKSASGAVEYVPQIHVVNLSRALDELQQAGYWCVGLAEEGTKNLSELDLSGRMVLVLGAEGGGLRQLTRKKCNELARLPTGGVLGSLNVSNAAAVALYETRRQKSKYTP